MFLSGVFLPKKYICFLVAAWSLSFGVAAAENTVPVSYDLNARIEPAAGTIAVRGRISVPLSEPGAKTLRFGLHETFAIKKLSVNGHDAKFSFQAAEPSMLNPATHDVIVALPKNLSAGTVQLEIAYRGRLKEIPEFGTFADQKQALDDQINARMVELANYSSWYPQFFAFGRPIEIRLEVSLPQGWTAICSGKKEDEVHRDGRAITRWSSAKDDDILITAAPNYKQTTIPFPGGEIEIYYTQLPQSFIDTEGRQIGAVIELFTQGLGEAAIPAGTVKHVFSPKRRGQGRAGISRPGMIVTSEGIVLGELAKDPKYSLLQDVAHEIAHFWWKFGTGQGDWINEAFAEYSSAVAVERIVSEEEFQSVLAGYRKEVRELPTDAPSLANVPFDGSGFGFVVRYYKGSLMLDSLRQTLGDDQFYAAARDFYQTYKDKEVGSAEFRGFWKQELGDKKGLVDEWLDSGGGAPKQVDQQTASHVVVY